MDTEIASIGSVSKISSNIFLPFGKVNLIVTLVVFCVLLIEGSFLAYQEKSLFPIFEKALITPLSADHSISKGIDDVRGLDIIKPDAWYKYPFSSYFWSWAFFWLNILTSLWFIYFVGLCIYWVVDSLYNASPFVSILFTLVIYFLLTSYANVLLYHSDLSGQTLPVSKVDVIKADLSNSVPFSGLFKLGKYLFTGNLWTKAVSVAEGGVPVFSNVPGKVNISNGGM